MCHSVLKGRFDISMCTMVSLVSSVVLCLYAVYLGSFIVTWWSGSGRTEAYLSGQLASITALILLVGSSGL